MKLDSNIFRNIDRALNASFEGGYNGVSHGNVIDLSSVFGGAAPSMKGPVNTVSLSFAGPR
jgi:hypothetical protein